MAKHRYSVEQLTKKDSENYLSDRILLRGVISDRMSDCTNVYSSLYIRLSELYWKVDNDEKLDS